MSALLKPVLTKRESNKLDKRIESIYYKRCSGIQIDIMDIPKIFNVARAAYMDIPELLRSEEYVTRELTKTIVFYVDTIRKN
jgi:hypothetical protein